MAKETIPNRAGSSAIDCILPFASKCAIGVSTYHQKFPWRKSRNPSPRAFNAVWFCLCATVDHRCGDGEQGLRHPGERRKKCRGSEPKNWSLHSRFARDHERARGPRIAEEKRR